MRFLEILRSIDWILFGCALLLVLVGLAMLFSATYSQAGLFTSRFVRQAIALCIAVVVALFVARIPYHTLARVNLLFYGVGLGALGLIAASSQVIRGTVSRFALGDLQIQPSEFMKVALILSLAWLFSRKDRLDLRVLLQSAALVGIPVIFIMLEPDLGVALLLVATWGLLLIFGGASWKIMSFLGLAGIGAFALGWQYVLAEYQKTRLLVFLDPTNDPLGAGYNVVQSIVALGSGRLFGRGLGHGPQSQLQFLPEQHTDFILASIGEELGFVGVAVVIILYGVLLWRILLVARNTKDSFGQFFAVGVFITILVSFVVSAGMNMGILPVTGIPLPLVSYGGSNLLSTFLLLGMVQSIRIYSKWIQPAPREISDFT